MSLRASDIIRSWSQIMIRESVHGSRGLLRPPPADFLDEAFPDACRPPVTIKALAAWEHRHEFRLPEDLRAWLLLSDGFYVHDYPAVHPLESMGPMIPFAQMPGMVVQPESWFELGNFETETVCIDLAYRWPNGGHSVFASGDDAQGTQPMIIARGFRQWFPPLLAARGRDYWRAADFRPKGDPWQAHRDHAPPPELPALLQPLAPRVRSLMQPKADDRSIADLLGISRGDVETIFRHLQHLS